MAQIQSSAHKQLFRNRQIEGISWRLAIDMHEKTSEKVDTFNFAKLLDHQQFQKLKVSDIFHRCLNFLIFTLLGCTGVFRCWVSGWVNQTQKKEEKYS